MATKTRKIANKFESPLWRDKTLAANALREIEKLVSAITSPAGKEINLMEVCGTHTMAIAASGIKNMLPKGLRMLSGPGCPVCVTSQGDIDRVLETAALKNVIITTFGDMMKVKGSAGRDLQSMRRDGSDVRIVYSPMDALELARLNPGKKVVFIGVGFETTAPAIACAVRHARREAVGNFFVTPLFKLVPPALEALLSGPNNIGGFVLPGHVSAIIGSNAYGFVADKYKVPCVVTGFEPVDILRGINMLLTQIARGSPKVETEYYRAVKPEGNPEAKKILAEVFTVSDAYWRAIGRLAATGLSFSGKYKRFDAFSRFRINYRESPEPKGCRCGDILMGKALPKECGLFGLSCTPSNAVGPCMVSSEGACAAWFKYGG
ncbi:MAG: hydrogenase formation protein HypD [Elusimicrobia bacterium]|nr:hydrogenase formation protein HypD [Elusimicrobiota bacterium]